MPATVLIASSAKVRIGASGSPQLECQLTGFRFLYPGTGEATVVFTACPSGAVSSPGEPVKGELSGDVLADYSTNGGTRYLIDHQGQQVPYEVVLNDDKAGQTVTIVGDCVPQPVEITWDPRKNQSNPLSVNVITASTTFA